jgi:hypothetical protein
MSVMTPRAPMVAKSAREPVGNNPLPAARAVKSPPTPRRRGRPPLCAPEQVIDEIRSEAAAGRLFRVHLDRPALYARARRLWGSWAGALRAAGLDPRSILDASRARAIETRRRKHQDAVL